MGTWGLETSVERVTGGAIVTARGRIGRPTADRFAEAMSTARRHDSRIVLDLQGVDYVSGLGLTALEQAADSTEALILCGVGEAVRNTLELAGLIERVQIEESRKGALDRLRAMAGA
jgi:anti-anti-sigma factor